MNRSIVSICFTLIVTVHYLSSLPYIFRLLFREVEHITTSNTSEQHTIQNQIDHPAGKYESVSITNSVEESYLCISNLKLHLLHTSAQ